MWPGVRRARGEETAQELWAKMTQSLILTCYHSDLDLQTRSRATGNNHNHQELTMKSHITHLWSCALVSHFRDALISSQQGRQWHLTLVLLPGKSHGWRSLVGYSPWGCEESDTTERLHFHFSLSCIGEGNGNTLQCSCLENPRDRGAWWAAVHGVAQSRT